ncbi:MAG: hypothetical protein K9L70_13365 [Thiohalocapsa sp.]|nr:hypothetical protein [Thiohalocapsa sp.]MCF7991647.1 hypothetical protein [Thiohalocapsa sp.]
MEVSTFEILYRPLTPPLGAGTEAIARRVLQGYFLTVANLDEDNDFVFRIEFGISLPMPANPSRTLDGNALLISDVAGPDNVFNTMLVNSPSGSNRFTANFTVPAGSTALVVLLPNITVPDFFTSGPEDVEIRGTVSLVLPCTFQPAIPPLGFGLLGTQPGAPARVLLNAEHRATYLPPGWPAVSGDLDFDQTGTAIALASGKALNEIESVPSCLLTVPDLEIPDLFERLPRIPTPIDPLSQMVELTSALARLDPAEENLNAMSRMLEELGIPIRLAAPADN